jgi:hypothetical protein
MSKILANRFYYLDNFHTVLHWIGARYDDLLDAEERDFIAQFFALPQASRALLVRMAMRKGNLFRASKLDYDEIGNTPAAAAPLLALGWIETDPLLTLEQVFNLLRKSEIAALLQLGPPISGMKKSAQLAALSDQGANDNTNDTDNTGNTEADAPNGTPPPRRLRAWQVGDDDSVNACLNDSIYHFRLDDLCDRFRLMFFGNLHQDWTEFVLSDLGIFTYEKVAFPPAARGFGSRADIDDYRHLFQCRERLQQGAPLELVLAAIPSAARQNDWLESRRNRLLFQLAQQYERQQQWPQALEVYRACRFPGARMRTIRMLERSGQPGPALHLAERAAHAPESEAEQQQLLRCMPRLQRQLGQTRQAARPATPVTRIDLRLSRLTTEAGTMLPVEEHVRLHLMAAQEPANPHPAPAFYVENTLINALFGLLCWDVIFSPLPGAFFHPFQSGPADLHSPDFYRRREAPFSACLAQLDSGQYQHTIIDNFHRKCGIQSPFVAWGMVSEALLQLALHCLPASHLRQWFERLLQDIPTNRSGMPDLIQFWPHERRYQMIEVKGPGDRLQDNQQRWLTYCATHQMPVVVCYVQWADQADDSKETGAAP